jgi:hypothetical protein
MTRIKEISGADEIEPLSRPRRIQRAVSLRKKLATPREPA